MDPKPEDIGPYHTVQQLRTNGVSTTYLAETSSKGRVAVQFVRLMHGNIDDTITNIKNVARIGHPNILDIIQVEQLTDYICVVSEYLRGTTLHDASYKYGALPEESVRLIGGYVARGLKALHEGGLVYRDLKLDTIFLTGDIAPFCKPQIKLYDFYLAAPPVIETSSIFAGTPAYMAPEQFEGKFDARSDIYSLGLIMYEIIHRERLFKSSELSLLFKEKSSFSSGNISFSNNISSSLKGVIAKCLSKEPSDRFPTATMLHDALMSDSFASVRYFVGKSEASREIFSQIAKGHSIVGLSQEGRTIHLTGNLGIGFERSANQSRIKIFEQYRHSEGPVRNFAVLRIEDVGEKITLSRWEEIFRGIRVLHALAYLTQSERASILSDTAQNGEPFDPCDLLFEDESIYLESVAPGSWYLTLWSYSRKSIRALWLIASMLFDRGRDAMLRKLEAESALRELEVEERQFELLAKKIDYSVSLTAKIDNDEGKRVISDLVKEQVKSIFDNDDVRVREVSDRLTGKGKE